MVIKKLYDTMRKAEQESNKLDELVIAGNYDLEPEWDEAYSTFIELREAFIGELMKLIKIDRHTAEMMLASDKLEQIMARA